MSSRPLSVIAGALLTPWLTGCQPPVYLMPTPPALQTANVDARAADRAMDRSDHLGLLYATNRLPLDAPAARRYAEIAGDDLRLGVATLRVVDENTTTGDLHSLPVLTRPRDRRELHLENLDERAVVGVHANLDQLSPEAAAFFADVNRALAASSDKDLFVYVHGAYNNVYRTVAQAAQYRQFTGRDSVVLAFAWPTVDNYLSYSTDVRSARGSVPAFIRLLELLARHTKAEHINILAHSAGAQITSAALAALGNETTSRAREDLRKRLRLGEVYYAAADIGLKAFVQDLRRYVDLPLRVTLQLTPGDLMLAMAAFSAGTSRAGRPNLNELGADERRWLRDQVAESRLDIIDVTSEHVIGLPSGAHAFWYERPWVSDDVLLEFLYHAPPEARGLQERVCKFDLRCWTFPSDYEQRMTKLIEEYEDRAGRDR